MKMNVAKQAASRILCTSFLMVICGSCCYLNEFSPKAYLSIPNFATEEYASGTHVQVAVCSDAPPGQEINPVFVMLSNRSINAWTVDASQVSACQGTCAGNSAIWLSIPPDEAARIAPIPTLEGAAAVAEAAGLSATYVGATAAAGGAFAAYAKANDISNGFSLGVSYGAIVGAVAGVAYELVRLRYSYETKEAGDANEKMKFLAL